MSSSKIRSRSRRPEGGAGASGPEVRAVVVGPGVDNVATAVAAIEPGERLLLDGHDVTVREPIPFGHKVAMRSIPQGGDIMKYREVIGRAVADISAGSHVHVHNVVSARLPGPAGGDRADK